ncbi:MAG: phosphocholine cytidylyltransferase family protein [Candidatus Hodarchaeales archaeon]
MHKMNVVILNSGVGRRMGELTREKPKSLVKLINDETILGRQIKALSSVDFNEIIMTTGPFENKLKKYIETNFPDLKIKYVFNPLFDKTNYIYSMHLISKHYFHNSSKILLLHGDMVFDARLLERMITSGLENSVLVLNSNELPEKDFKCRIEFGDVRRVLKIGVDVFGRSCYPLFPVYKFESHSFLSWLNIIDKFVGQGKRNVYAEDALNTILTKINLVPTFFELGEVCTEIDNLEDLRNVRELLSK